MASCKTIPILTFLPYVKWNYLIVFGPDVDLSSLWNMEWMFCYCFICPAYRWKPHNINCIKFIFYLMEQRIVEEPFLKIELRLSCILIGLLFPSISVYEFYIECRFKSGAAIDGWQLKWHSPNMNCFAWTAICLATIELLGVVRCTCWVSK